MKRIVLFASLSLSFIGVGAQGVLSQDVVQKQKSINQVKLSEDAVYAEVIQMVTGDDEAISLAQQKSIDKLQISVIEACAAKMKMSKEDVKEIFDVIDDKCQNITIDAGDIIRVFSYISKDAIGLTPRKPKEKDVKEIFGSNILNQSVHSAERNNEGSLKSDLTLQTKNEVASVEEPVIIPVPVTLVTSKEDTKTEEAKKDDIKKVEPKVESVPAPKPVSEVIVPSLCETMISKVKMNELMRFLNQEKKYQRLMFGNKNSMQFSEKCYIVIIDKSTQNIVTVLGKGESERMNYVSKQMDNLANYRGGNYAAIYVQEY